MRNELTPAPLFEKKRGVLILQPHPHRSGASSVSPSLKTCLPAGRKERENFDFGGKVHWLIKLFFR
jgi:hypothetical protein